MIKINNTDCKVVIEIEGISSSYGPIKFSFERTEENWWSAVLVQDAIRKRLYKRVKGIRKHAYNKGYKDGRAKRGKQDYFSSWIYDEECT